MIRVRAQVSRGTKSVAPRRSKTKAGRRDIALAGELEPYLREHMRATEIATGLPRADAYVFTTSSGKPLNRNRKPLVKAVCDDGACRARTGDPQLAKLVLSQLS